MTQTIQDTIQAAAEVYIDVYHFEPNTKSIEVTLSANVHAVLGQFWRFYLYTWFAYFTFILLIHHILVMFKPRVSTTTYPQFLMTLSQFNSIQSFFAHFFLSLLLSLLVFILQSFNSDFLMNDVTELTRARISFGPGIVLFMYWSAFLTTNMAFLGIFLFKFCLSFINSNVLKFKNRRKIFPFLWAFHFALTLILCVFVSTLAIFSILVYKFTQLVFYSIKFKSANRGNLETTKKLQNLEVNIVLTFLLAALNIPGLITWFGLVPIVGLKPLFANTTGDLGLLTASLYFVLYIFESILLLKGHIRIKGLKYTNFFKRFLICFVFLNCIFCFFYSVLSIYRLQYFILGHLFLMLIANNLSFLIGIFFFIFNLESRFHKENSEEVVQTIPIIIII